MCGRMLWCACDEAHRFAFESSHVVIATTLVVSPASDVLHHLAVHRNSVIFLPLAQAMLCCSERVQGKRSQSGRRPPAHPDSSLSEMNLGPAASG